MLHAVAREDRPAAVVELDRDADDERALRVAQPLGDELVDVGVRERLLELRERRSVERRLPLQIAVLGRNLLHFGHARSVGARVPGEGVEPLRPREGTPDFKSGAYHQFRHPGGPKDNGRT